MADIKIKEGSLTLKMGNKVLEDTGHRPGQAVHIQFQNSKSIPVANYTFVNGKLVAAADNAQFREKLLNFDPDTVPWEVPVQVERK